jgi:hypothetical protein
VGGADVRRWGFRVAVAVPLFVLVVGAWQVNLVLVAAWLPAEVADDLLGSQLARDGIAGSGFAIHRIHYLALAAAHLAVIAALVLQLRRPRDHEAPMWQASVGLGLAMTTWLLVDTTSIPPFVPVILISVVVAGALHPTAPVLRRPRAADPTMLLAAGALALPLLVFGAGQLRIQMAASGGSTDAHLTALHYNFMAEYALQLTVAAWAGASAMRGWRWSVRIAAAMAALLGLGFTVYPDLSSSRGPVWGLLLAGWGALWLWLGERRHRREGAVGTAEPSPREPIAAV